MLVWGVEDLDFGLRTWMMGHSILHDPEAVVGHRFRSKFDTYEVPYERLLVNQLRMARKVFTTSVWNEWVERCQRRHANRHSKRPEGLWAHAWQPLPRQQGQRGRWSRASVQGGRARDEFAYAERFGLAWPKIRSEQLSPGLLRLEADQPVQGSPSPTPPPSCRISASPAFVWAAAGATGTSTLTSTPPPDPRTAAQARNMPGPNIQMEHRGLGRRVARAHLERQWEHRDCGSYQWPRHDRRKLRESARGH